jgi:ATP synthase protein I
VSVEAEGVDREDSQYSREVRRKSERLRRARRHRTSAWRTLATVGTLGWMLALPIVAGGMIGQALSRTTGRPLLALAMILLGVGIGCYTTWRYIRRSLGGSS